MPVLSTLGAMSARGFGFGAGEATPDFFLSGNQQELNLATYLTGQGWNGTSKVWVQIDSGVYIWSDSTSTAGLTIPSSLNGLLTITNYGYIIGKGGNGGRNAESGLAGGPAISNSATGVIFFNEADAYIAGGGGGGGGSGVGAGGGGAGGGNGGNLQVPNGGYGGSGGSVGNAGGNGAIQPYAGDGGGAGGGGGGYNSDDGGFPYQSGGGGGGRILTGSGGGGGTSGGGTGGSAGNAGSSGVSGAGGGGGGWGAAGGSGGYAGGAGGAAISGTAIAEMTNNGTIYGTQAT